MNKLLVFQFLFFLCLLIGNVPSSHSADTKKDLKIPAQNISPDQVPLLFQSEEPLKIELEAAFIKPGTYREGMLFDGKDARFRQTETKETPENPAKNMAESATLRYEAEPGKPVEHKIEWHTRGRMRRSDPIPPMTLLLPENFKDPVFDGLYRKIKIVSHGRDGDGPRDTTSGSHNLEVQGEHLSYKLMEALGLPALRTRRLAIKYFDPDGRYLTEGAGLMLEPVKTLAARLGKEEKEWESEDGDEYILQKTFPVEDYTKQALAQAMLGHTDWGPAYNVIQLVDPGTGKSTLVGYDFDQTEITFMVKGRDIEPTFDASAFIAENANLQEILNWRSEEFPDEKLDFETAYRKVAAEFLARKEKVLAVLNSVTLKGETKEKVRRYLTQFFTQLEQMP